MSPNERGISCIVSIPKIILVAVGKDKSSKNPPHAKHDVTGPFPTHLSIMLLKITAPVKNHLIPKWNRTYTNILGGGE